MPTGAATNSSKLPRAPLSPETVGQRIISALPLLWAKSVSLHDASGAVCWHHGEVFGVPEREAMRAAVDCFSGTGAPARVNHSLQRERTAVMLRAEAPDGRCLGFAMLVVDDRWLRGKAVAAPDLPVPVIRAVREWSNTLLQKAPVAAAPSPGVQPARGIPSVSPETVHAPVDAQEIINKIKAFPFELHFQHLIPLQTGIRIRRHEVLIRDRSGPVQSVAPERWIMSAEHHGYGAELDRRVLVELIGWLAARREIWAGEPAQFSVNLTPSSYRDETLPRFLADRLRMAELPPRLLAVELQHQWCVGEPARYGQIARDMDAAGVALVIDNFRLSEQGIDLMLQRGVGLAKLDPMLTQKLAGDRANQARIAAIAQAARVAGVHVVAKRIESEQAGALLQGLGVDFLQGFVASEPAALDRFDDDRARRQLIDEAVEADAAIADTSVGVQLTFDDNDDEPFIAIAG
jgi:EAL domain-containing protein (putative c-di-GMP-specific phosphodiesterase class I)